MLSLSPVLAPCSLVGFGLARCHIYGPPPCRKAAWFSANLRPRRSVASMILLPTYPNLVVRSLASNGRAKLRPAPGHCCEARGQQGVCEGPCAGCTARADAFGNTLARGPSCAMLLFGDSFGRRWEPLINTAPAAPNGILLAHSRTYQDPSSFDISSSNHPLLEQYYSSYLHHE